MTGLAFVWQWWTDTWRAPRRARLLYGTMALAFAALTAVAGVLGEPAVAVVAGVAAGAALGLAAMASRLARWTER